MFAMTLFDLLTWEEYSVMCDRCDRESTRDGNQNLALRQAVLEGFCKVDGPDGDIVCSDCLGKVQSSIAGFASAGGLR